MDHCGKSYRELERECVDRGEVLLSGIGTCPCTTRNQAALARALQARGRSMRRQLLDFELWLVREIGFSPATARRKVKLAGGALADFPDTPWLKVRDYNGERCLGVRSPNYRREIELALERLAEWIIEDADKADDERLALAEGVIRHLGLDAAEIVNRINLRLAQSDREESDG